MIKREKIEVACIMVVIFGLYFYAKTFNQDISFGRLLLGCSALLLLQGLIRDVCILFFSRKKNVQNLSNNDEDDKVKMPCMCIESTLGMLGIIIGGVLLFAASGMNIQMTTHTWWVLLSSVVIVGFLVKDYVLHWDPWKIAKEREHINVLFGFKK